MSRIPYPKPCNHKRIKCGTLNVNPASAVRAQIKHVFAHQKNRFGLFIGTIGIKRAEAKLTLAHLGYIMDRLIFHERRAATG